MFFINYKAPLVHCSHQWLLKRNICL